MENKIIFAKEGKLIPQVSFATIGAKIDFKSLRQESDEICKTSQVLSERLHHAGSDMSKRKWQFQPPKFIKKDVDTLALLEPDLANKEMTREGEPSSNQW